MNSWCSVFIATSLDGFISRSDGGIDWLNEANALLPPGESCGFAEFSSTVDGLMMGRNTFDPVLLFPEWPYGSKFVAVLSHSLRSLSARVPATATLSVEPPAPWSNVFLLKVWAISTLTVALRSNVSFWPISLAT